MRDEFARKVPSLRGEFKHFYPSMRDFLCFMENIHENSVGYVKAMEQLANFKRSDGKVIFIFASLLKKK